VFAGAIHTARLLLVSHGFNEDQADTVLDGLRKDFLRGALNDERGRRESLERQVELLSASPPSARAPSQDVTQHWREVLAVAMQSDAFGALFDSLAQSTDTKPGAALPPGRIEPGGIDAPFVWPATGDMQVTLLRGGGCNIKFSFPDQGIVRAIGQGRVMTAKNIPTKRIARRYEILIRHSREFVSSYSIVDQTPNARAGGVRPIPAEGDLVEGGSELYDVQNGGFLHFQLSRGGKLIDPREFIPGELPGVVGITLQPPES